MSEWREFEFGEIAEIQTGPFGSQLVKDEYIDGGIPVITVENIKDFQIESFTYPSVTQDKSTQLSRYFIQEGDVLFSRVGSVDLSALVKKEQDGWIISSRMLRARLNDFGNAQFVAYFLQQSKVRRYINAIAVGATMPSINTSILKSIPIRLPQLETQIAIAEVLSSLDDKIDLLKRQNKTLEGMAEALFRQWFIEEAQDDWPEIEMGGLIEIRNGKDHKHLGEGDIPVYGSGGLMRKADGFLFEGESVLLPRKGTLNNVMMVNEAFWTVDTMFYTEMKRPNLMKFVFHHFKRLDLASMNVGSAVPSMTKTAYNHITVLMPPESKLEAFEMEVSRLFERVKSNHDKIQNLKAQRDTLLPKLMSGEVRVKLD